MTIKQLKFSDDYIVKMCVVGIIISLLFLIFPKLQMIGKLSQALYILPFTLPLLKLKNSEEKGISISGTWKFAGLSFIIATILDLFPIFTKTVPKKFLCIYILLFFVLFIMKNRRI